ncbi:MAG: excinuclease ABC subunit UvrB [Mycoplasma sp.]|nr:excinuclease ABC subunit UvrB [Mycoplasma sp.]
MSLKLETNFKPSGDQPEAIKKLVKGVNDNVKNQVLLGVTGSGKTFTIANVINSVQRPVLVLSHNKTLASQLYSELKTFFPNNNVEYFVSYFDYYRPEAYLPRTDVYVEKTSKTNHDLEMMRMSTMNSLLTSRDTIVVASVAAIYGANKPEEYEESFLTIEVNQKIKRNDFFVNLIQQQYVRNPISIEPGEFSVKGDVVELSPGWTNNYNLRIEFFDDTIDAISKIDPLTKKVISKENKALIYPASSYVIQSDNIDGTIQLIELELEQRLKEFKKQEKHLEYQRLKDRTNNDIDSLREFGHCSGIENYSRHIDRRKEGEKPYTLFDYLPKDTLLIIDESHMMIPQLNGMYNGDRSRKLNLVEYGFRLPSALDNRPLKFEEFEKYDFQKIFISATPGNYELDLTNGEVVTQYIRPTGLLDPIIEIHPSTNQVDDMYDEIQNQIKNKLRTIIVTTTKKTAEELTKYFQSKKIKIAYIHSEHKTLERNEILRKLRKGIYDVVIGINLLREGIDLPEVSLIMVLDADKESFFRSKSSLIQIVGRAARNEKGRVIFYANSISKSMKETIEDNKMKRAIQIEYNKKQNITPKTISKPIFEPIEGHDITNAVELLQRQKSKSKSKQDEFEKIISNLRKEMKVAADKLDFERATQIRDIILELESEQ